MITEITEAIKNMFLGGTFGIFTGTLLVVGILLSIGIYVYVALAWQTIAKKLKYKNPWLAWIPFANMAMILELGEFNWRWIFLILIPLVLMPILLIPIFGWIIWLIFAFLALTAVGVLTIIATWRIFEKRNYPGWFSLSMIIPQIGFVLYLIAIGFVAWSDKTKSKLSKK